MTDTWPAPASPGRRASSGTHPSPLQRRADCLVPWPARRPVQGVSRSGRLAPGADPDRSRVPGPGAGPSPAGRPAGTADAEGAPVTLSVLAGNPARRLYEAMGFTAQETRGQEIEMRYTPRAPRAPGHIRGPLGGVNRAGPDFFRTWNKQGAGSVYPRQSPTQLFPRGTPCANPPQPCWPWPAPPCSLPPSRPSPSRPGRRPGHEAGMTLYTFDKDAGGKSACNDQCAKIWPPVMAAADAKASGDLTIITRDDGGKQWAYKGKPVYLYARTPRPATRPATTSGRVARQALIRRARRSMRAEDEAAILACIPSLRRYARGLAGDPHAPTIWSRTRWSAPGAATRAGNGAASCAHGCSASCTTISSTACAPADGRPS